MNGSDITGESPDGTVLAGLDIIQGGLIEAYLLKAEEKIVVLLDEFLQVCLNPHEYSLRRQQQLTVSAPIQVYIYPDTPRTRQVYEGVVDKLSFPIRGAVENRQRILGHKIGHSIDGRRPLAYATWTFTLPDGEYVQALAPQASQGPIASLGKVLGNRTTLYKYLNPRLFTALTAIPTTAMCGIYVMDAAKGTVVYHAEVKATLKGCEIKSTLVENWLVYHYYEGEVAGGTVGGTKGYRMVSVEFYEGKQADEKTERCLFLVIAVYVKWLTLIFSFDLSPHSRESINLRTFEKAYIFPYAVTAMAPTTTKFGITSKDIIGLFDIPSSRLF